MYSSLFLDQLVIGETLNIQRVTPVFQVPIRIIGKIAFVPNNIIEHYFECIKQNIRLHLK